MSRVEEMVAVRAGVPQAMRYLTMPERMRRWIAPHVTLVPLTAAPTLGPGDRFRLELLGALVLSYQVEAASDRELVLSFSGPWRGRERWSVVADGAETIVRRVYEVDDAALSSWVAWSTIGRPLVFAHLRLELARFRDAVEHEPGPPGEIEARPPMREFPIEDG